MEWNWETSQQKSFKALKSQLSNAPVLRFFDVNKDVTLSVDACSEGLGAVILQEEHPVAYGSQSLTDSEKVCSD